MKNSLRMLISEKCLKCIGFWERNDNKSLILRLFICIFFSGDWNGHGDKRASTKSCHGNRGRATFLLLLILSLHMSSFCMMSGYLCLNIWATETNYI